MKIVIDTNVVVSGIFFSGPPSRILSLCVEGKFTLVLSRPIVDEYLKIVERIGKRYPDIEAGPIVEALIISADIIEAPGVEVHACKDPDDDKFLECAIAGKCRVIVSGDRHLLALSPYRDIDILTPRFFLERYGEKPK
jgi:putative PIN family toxin of toxin-antitoxin system